MRPQRLKPDPADAADPARVEAAAMRFLARREYAAGELRDKLVQRGYDARVVRTVVDALTAARLQDDARFVESFVRARVERGQGPLRIALELKHRGISEDEVDAAMAVAADWHALAAKVRARRFGAELPHDWPERAKQARFLEQRGFTREQARAALAGEVD